MIALSPGLSLALPLKEIRLTPAIFGGVRILTSTLREDLNKLFRTEPYVSLTNEMGALYLLQFCVSNLPAETDRYSSCSQTRSARHIGEMYSHLLQHLFETHDHYTCVYVPVYVCVLISICEGPVAFSAIPL